MATGIYDKNDEKPAIKPDLKHLEGMGPNSGGQTSTANSTKGSNSLSPKGLSGAEPAKGSSTNTGVGGNVSQQFGGSFYTGSSDTGQATAATGFAKIRQLATSAVAGRRKFAVGGAGGGIVLLIVGILGFGSVVSYEIVNIEKTIFGYEEKVEAYVDKKVAQSLTQKMVCWKVKSGCKDDPAEDSDKLTTAEEATDSAEGVDGPVLAEEMDSFDFTNPEIVADLAKVGYTVETSGGVFTGLYDSNGNNITEDIGTNPDVMANLEVALPEEAVGQIISLRPTISAEARASWDVLPDTPDDNAQDDITNVVEHGADASQLNGIVDTEDDNADPGKNAPPQTKANFSDGTEQSGALGDAETAVEDALDKGESMPEATQAGVSAYNLGSVLLLSTIVSDACSIKQAATIGANHRVATIIGLLIRHASTIGDLAGQLQTGKVTTNEVDSFMQLFNGDSSLAPNADGTKQEASLPFTSSAAWQRSIGGTVNTSPKSPNFTPDIANTALPNANTGTSIVSNINSSLPVGSSFVCSVENSFWGGIANGIGGVLQLAADDFTLDGSQLAITAGVTGFQELLQHQILPEILKYFTPLGVNGHEDSVQWLNNADAGTNLMENNYSRREGAGSVTRAVANTMTTEANHNELSAAAQLPLSQRLFALSNPYSLASHFFDQLPLGFAETMSSFTSYFTSFPGIFLHSIASIFSPVKVFGAASNVNPGIPYNISQYTFTDSSLQKYDPIQNETYLFKDVCYAGNCARRIDMLGNPNLYTDSVVGDPNNNDLLHCFVDTYDTPDPNNGIPGLADVTDSSNNATKMYCGGQPTPTLKELLNGGPFPNGNIMGGLGTYDDSTDPDTGQPYDDPNDVPGNAQVIQIYCQSLASNPTDTACDNAIAPQVNDDVGHFQQYLLDTHVMSDYISLSNTQ